ncbi:MAG: hypothetical protein M1820_004749 [Bogoriella megaspora]|nr:MAG: hypothetical protein M1820_004749 [Bogoriella megaspora]
MADPDESVASAVVVPDAEERAGVSAQSPQLPEESNSLKRRQSSISPSSPKRARLDSNNDSRATRQELLNERRRRVQAEDRKRNQRLFGGLLNTLNQSAKSGLSGATREKQKAEIEKRQAEKLKRKDVEYVEEKKRKLDALMKARKKEQRVVDEQALRIRHSNMRAMAHSLQTESEPKLYYIPWDITHAEEDRIKKQIDEVEDKIDREFDDFEEQRKQWQQEDEAEAESDTVTKGNVTDEPGTNNGQAEISQASGDAEDARRAEGDEKEFLKPVDSKEVAEDPGAQVVDAEEDAVLY